MVVDGFTDHYELNLGSRAHARRSNLGLSELVNICIVPLLVVGLLVIDAGLTLGIGEGSRFPNLFVELDFRQITLGPSRVPRGLYSSFHVLFWCPELQETS